MPSIAEVASRDATKTITVPLDAPGVKVTFPVSVTYYPNRLTLEPVDLPEPEEGEPEAEESDRTSLRNAASFCDMVASWDLTGPLANRRGEEVVPADVPIPMRPEVIRCVPSWITVQVTQAVMDREFPNRTGARASRRR